MQDVKAKEIYITILLIGINIMLFAIPLIMYGSITTETMIRMGAQFWPLIHSGEWWRLFTCNFLHFSAQHVMGNMIVLFALGSIMEPIMGHLKFLVLYLISGIAGSTLSYFVNMLRAANVVAAGASTCVYGLLGAMACIIFLGYGTKIGIYISKKRFVLLAVLNILANIIGETNIDYMGHLGGLIAGAIVFIIMGKTVMKPTGEEMH